MGEFAFLNNEVPTKHVMILKMKELSKAIFFKKISLADEKSIIVFIHGYNVKHKEALWRSVQLKYDLNFKGTMISYSWPSNGSTYDYFIDESNIQWTEPKLKLFLTDLKVKLKPRKIHIIAHSMGNRAFTRVLYELSKEYKQKLFNQIILAAPDIDAEVFKQRIKPAISLAENYTLYCSNDDLPLNISKFIHEYPRAGDGGENVVVMPDIDTIDATRIKGGLLEHSYFAKELLDDLKILFKGYKKPTSRNFIPRIKNNIEYWYIP